MAFEKHVSVREKSRQIKREGSRRFQAAVADGSYVKKADYGRQWVYQKEDNVYIRHSAILVNMTIDELKTECEKVFADERVQAIDPFKGQPIYVQNSCRVGAITYPYRRLMRFGTEKSNFIMLHEIAHMLAPADKHGRIFCRILVQLNEWFTGPEVAQDLAWTFGMGRYEKSV
jgi:hypothetical protein